MRKPTTTTTTGVRGPTILPGPLRTPHYGTYAVRTVANDQPATGTLYVGRDGTQRLMVNHAARTTKLRWSTQGELLRSGDGRSEGSCNWTPPAIVIATALTEGRRWSTTVRCTSQVGEITTTVTRQESAKVTQRVRTDIDGKPIDTWMIERHVVATQHADGTTVVIEEASTELFAPSIGMAVYKLSRTDFPRADGTVESVLESIELATAVPY